MNIGEIFVKLGFDGKGFTQGLSNARKQLSLFALEVTATVYLIDRFLERSTNAATSLINLGKASGIADTKLKQMGIAATLSNAGVSAEDAATQIAAFSKNLYELQHFGTGNAQGFNALGFIGRGVSFYGKNTEQVIADIRKQIRGLTDQQAVNILEKFGFTPAMLDFFRKTDEELASLGKQFQRTKDQIDQLHEADQVINEFKQSLSFLADTIAVEAAPALKNLNKTLQSFSTNGFWATWKTGLGNWYASSNAKGARERELKAQYMAQGMSAEEAADAAHDEVNRGATPPSTPPGGQSRNNFGNIRGASGEFLNFATPAEGMKALYDDIAAKVGGKSSAMTAKYGQGYTATIGKLISTYAPPTENDTARYIDFVSKKTGIDPNRPLNAGDIDGIVKSITQMEGNKNVDINNTYHVQGGDAHTIAGAIVDKQQRQLNHALADQNNGAY